MKMEDGKKRVVIEAVSPEIDGGRFPIKRTVGEKVVVEADVFADGHDVLSCRLLYRKGEESGWTHAPMKLLGNDRWRGVFEVTETGTDYYTLQAWVDWFLSWRQTLTKKAAAGQEVSVDLLIGAEILENLIPNASGEDPGKLKEGAKGLRSSGETAAAGGAGQGRGACRRCGPVPGEKMGHRLRAGAPGPPGHLPLGEGGL